MSGFKNKCGKKGKYQVYASPECKLYWATLTQGAVEGRAKRSVSSTRKPSYQVEAHFSDDAFTAFAGEYQEACVEAFGEKKLKKTRLLAELGKEAKIYKGKDEDGEAEYDVVEDHTMLVFRSPYKFPDGKPTAQPLVVDKHTGQWIDPERVGNGSEGKVLFAAVPYEPKGDNPKYGITMSLHGIVISKLVEREGSAGAGGLDLGDLVDAPVTGAPTPMKGGTVKVISVPEQDELDDEIPF